VLTVSSGSKSGGIVVTTPGAKSRGAAAAKEPTPIDEPAATTATRQQTEYSLAIDRRMEGRNSGGGTVTERSADWVNGTPISV
jgi:hypothetical protein